MHTEILRLVILLFISATTLSLGNYPSASDNQQISKVFKEVAKIGCIPSNNRPKFYSQPTGLDVWVKHVRWHPQQDLLAVWCSNTPDIYIFDTSPYEVLYALVDPTPEHDELETELSWSPSRLNPTFSWALIDRSL